MTIKDFNDIRGFLGERAFTKAYGLYCEDTVTDFRAERGPNAVRIRGCVEDEEFFNCNCLLGRGSISCRCDCERFGSESRCAHIGALMMEYVHRTQEGQDARDESDSAAEKLLDSYNQTGHVPESPVKLVPLLSLQNGRPSCAFKIGRDKLYMIKGIMEFRENVRYRRVCSYGEGFSFDHDINAFDPRSKRLCQFLLDYTVGLEYMLWSRKPAYRQLLGDIRDISLSGEDFDMLFDMYKGEKLPCREGGSLLLCEGDEKLKLSLVNRRDGVLVSIDGSVRLFETGSHAYLLTPGVIRRVGESYARAAAPLINSRASGEGIVLSPKKAEKFCCTVVPRIAEFVDEAALAPLEKYMPESLSVRFLLDMPERGKLTARPDFTYDGKYVQCGADENAYPDIRRNIPEETAALEALKRFFEAPETGEAAYTLSDEDRMYDLLKSGADELSKHGSVFISDRLRNIMNGKTPRPTVRAGVKNGMLELKLDTDEFPVEELEQLMRSVREKRRYYRLRDGSFLNLEDGRFSAFTRTADSLNLDARSMADTGSLVPLYKAMFLDDALKSGTGVQLEKDTDYKRLIRDFKTFEEGDFKVPEPLDKALREYQKTGYMWLRTLDKYGFGGILADDMGLGKSLQLLAFVKGLKNEGETGPALIACPASVIISWGGEINKWVPELKSLLLTGSAAERDMLLSGAENYDIIVTGYDSLRNDIERHAKNRYRLCVLDEAQYIKNKDTKLARAVKRIAARTRLALTGTPVENRLSELWSIFDFVMPGYLGTYQAFREKYEAPVAENGDETARSTLSKLVRPFVLRRMKKDVLSELPPKTETNCFVQMGDAQRRLYLAYANEVKKRMESASSSDKLLILSMLTRLRQICCDPALCAEGYEGESCKLDECVRMVKELTESSHRVLIFSQFTSMLSRIEDRLGDEGIAAFTLRGDTALSDRQRLVNAFNAGERDVFLISLKAGGTGLNLTGADTVIHYDPWWNLAAQNQATDRCYRIGQSKAVQVYKLIASDTIEENILNLQYKKLDLANIATENADGSLMSMTSEELMELLK